MSQRPRLVNVGIISLLAVLSGAGGPTAIARRAAHKEGLLVRVLDLPNGFPRQAVIRGVLMGLKPTAFQAGFADRLRSLRAETGVD